jgi:sugar O-acyltransferase (sialic acid O-acetyltransferase NeuD family)
MLKELQQQNDLKVINMYLYGASGHSKVVIDIVKELNVDIQGVLDDFPKAETICDIAIFQTTDVLLGASDLLIISIGNNAVRKKIAEKMEVNFCTAIHPSAVVSKNAIINPGTVVMPNAVVNAFASIGKHCIVNSGAVVEHDCQIADFVHISPNAALAGDVSVGEGSQIGIGASVIQGLTIGKWVTVGAGAVIINDIPDYAVVVGNPGRVIKFNTP